MLVALVIGTFWASANVGGLGRPRARDEVPVTPMDMRAQTASNSPLLVADPADPRFVVLAYRLDAPDFGCAVQLSGDGGRSWSPADPVPQLPSGADKCYAPEAAFDTKGKLFFLFVGLHGNGNEPMGAFLTTSTDHARTFAPPVEVLGPLNFGVRMAIDRSTGRMHIVWLHAGAEPSTGGFQPVSNPVLSAHSDDGGHTFSAPVQVSDPGRGRVVAPALALGPAHAVHVAYYDLGADAIDYEGLDGPTWDGKWSLVVSTSRDGGTGFDHGVVVDADVAPPGRVMLVFTMPPPSVAAGPGRLACAAWTDSRNGDADAVGRCSSDAARTWGPLRRLNDDPLRNGLSQYLPRLSFSASGRLDAAFFDRRSDQQNVRTDVFYTYSTDGGRHFAPNIKASARPSDSRIGQEYEGAAARGQVELGSRLGLLSRRSGALAAWPDTRNSMLRTTVQDVFAAQIDAGSGAPGRLLALGAGGTLSVAGLLWLISRRRHRRPNRMASHPPVPVPSAKTAAVGNHP